jgi:hypothetical protein
MTQPPNDTKFPSITQVVKIPTEGDIKAAQKFLEVTNASLVGVGNPLHPMQQKAVKDLFASIKEMQGSEAAISDAAKGLAGVKTTYGQASEIAPQPVPAGKPSNDGRKV